MKAKGFFPERSLVKRGATTERPAQRYLVTFDHFDDPSPGELAEVVERLLEAMPSGASVEVATPGAVVVEGAEPLIREAIGGLEDWTVSQEGALSSPSPYHLLTK